MRAKINRRIVSAIGMLELVLKNKWDNDEKIERTEAAINLAKYYIRAAEHELEILKNKSK